MHLGSLVLVSKLSGRVRLACEAIFIPYHQHLAWNSKDVLSLMLATGLDDKFIES